MSAASREQTCQQCSASYRAQRASSRYCGGTCKKRAQRGVPPVNRQRMSVVLALLLRLSLAGQIGPVNNRDPRPAVYGLTVPRFHAFATLCGIFNSKGWGVLSEAEFAAELKGQNIIAYDEAPPVRQRKR